MAAADDWARKLHLEIRERVLRRVLRTDRRTGQLYERAARRIRKRLRATGFTDAEVAAILREELEAVESELLPLVEADIREAAERGHEGARDLLEELDALETAAPFRSGPRRQRLERRLASWLRRGSGGSSPSTG